MTFFNQLMGWAARMASDSSTQFIFWMFFISMLALMGISVLSE